MSETSPLEVHVLASGSKGNCTVIKKGNSVILHDVGISCRRADRWTASGALR